MGTTVNNPLGLKVTAREDGSLEAAYLRIADQSVSSTKEVVKNRLLVDFADNGNVVGIEILGPVAMSQLSRLVPKKQGRERMDRFMRVALPHDLILAERVKKPSSTKSRSSGPNTRKSKTA